MAFISNFSLANDGNSTTKDTLNILAPKDVWLRSEAILQSDKLVKLPYATKLILLENDSISETITVQETKYFEIEGKMQKVRVMSKDKNINNLEGYVFDGYLTRFPVPNLEYETQRNEQDEFVYADLNYFRKNFTNGKKQKVKKFNVFEGKETWCGWEQNFGEDINYEYSNCTESGQDIEIKFQGLSMREAYFFAIVLYYPKEDVEVWHDYIILFNKEDHQIIIKPKDGGAGCFYTITQRETTINIKYECWGC